MPKNQGYPPTKAKTRGGATIKKSQGSPPKKTGRK